MQYLPRDDHLQFDGSRFNKSGNVHFGNNNGTPSHYHQPLSLSPRGPMYPSSLYQGPTSPSHVDVSRFTDESGDESGDAHSEEHAEHDEYSAYRSQSKSNGISEYERQSQFVDYLHRIGEQYKLHLKGLTEEKAAKEELMAAKVLRKKPAITAYAHEVAEQRHRGHVPVVGEKNIALFEMASREAERKNKKIEAHEKEQIDGLFKPQISLVSKKAGKKTLGKKALTDPNILTERWRKRNTQREQMAQEAAAMREEAELAALQAAPLITLHPAAQDPSRRKGLSIADHLMMKAEERQMRMYLKTEEIYGANTFQPQLHLNKLAKRSHNGSVISSQTPVRHNKSFLMRAALNTRGPQLRGDQSRRVLKQNIPQKQTIRGKTPQEDQLQTLNPHAIQKHGRNRPSYGNKKSSRNASSEDASSNDESSSDSDSSSESDAESDTEYDESDSSSSDTSDSSGSDEGSSSSTSSSSSSDKSSCSSQRYHRSKLTKRVAAIPLPASASVQSHRAENQPSEFPFKPTTYSQFIDPLKQQGLAVHERILQRNAMYGHRHRQALREEAVAARQKEEREALSHSILTDILAERAYKRRYDKSALPQTQNSKMTPRSRSGGDQHEEHSTDIVDIADCLLSDRHGDIRGTTDPNSAAKVSARLYSDAEIMRQKRKQKTDKPLHVKNKDIPIWSSQSKGCPFVGRCGQVMDKCSQAMPEVAKISDEHFVRCYLYAV